MKDSALIVSIEDEPPIRRFLHTCLTQEGYRFEEAGSGTEGLKVLTRVKPDLLILDLGLPDIDGIALIRQIREWSGIPIIVLTARDQEKEKVEALDAGADDYLVKPFGVDELLARIRVALRHMAQMHTEQTTTEVCTGDLKIDFYKRRILKREQEVHLTPIEYKLLTLLVKHRGKVLTHRQILKEVWGASHIEHGHYLRIYMGQLRQKLEDDPTTPQYFLTETGVGYRFIG